MSHAAFKWRVLRRGYIVRLIGQTVTDGNGSRWSRYFLCVVQKRHPVGFRPGGRHGKSLMQLVRERLKVVIDIDATFFKNSDCVQVRRKQGFRVGVRSCQKVVHVCVEERVAKWVEVPVLRLMLPMFMVRDSD